MRKLQNCKEHIVTECYIHVRTVFKTCRTSCVCFSLDASVHLYMSYVCMHRAYGTRFTNCTHGPNAVAYDVVFCLRLPLGSLTVYLRLVSTCIFGPWTSCMHTCCICTSCTHRMDHMYYTRCIHGTYCVYGCRSRWTVLRLFAPTWSLSGPWIVLPKKSYRKHSYCYMRLLIGQQGLWFDSVAFVLSYVSLLYSFPRLTLFSSLML